jgi:glycosyltransferase involved in cell wall biosynthesis
MVREVFKHARCDVFTFHATHELLPDRLDAAIVRESRLARLPGIRQRGHHPGHWRSLLPYMPYYFRALDLDRYDLVVASSHACAVQAAAATSAPSICYCHTPMRYAWLPDTDGDRVHGVKGAAMRASSRWLRRIDRAAAMSVDGYVANSTAVRDRIRHFYRRGAEVIHPPVDVREFFHDRPKEKGHFLWVHRLVSYKQPEVVAAAFRGLPYRLTMVGVGPLEHPMRASLPPNVELRGWLDRAELIELYEQSSGFIHIGEEDFGITMVEALAAGTPVIALSRGGSCDVIRPDQDGVLIDQPSVAALRAAIYEVAERSWSPTALAKRAEQFSVPRFVQRLGDYAAQLRSRVATLDRTR